MTNRLDRLEERDLVLVVAAIGHVGQRTTQPPPELTVSELFGDPDGLHEVLLGAIQITELAADVAALRGGVRELPPRTELLEDGDSALDARKRVPEPAEVFQHPTALNAGDRDAELIADPLRKRHRVHAELEGLIEIASAVTADR